MAAKISFASFNLLNFQKVGGKIYNRGQPVTHGQFNKKRDWIREKLLEVDADVVIFQELWAKSCLDAVFTDPALSDYTPVYIGNTWYNIAVAAAVRTPWRVKQKKVIKDFPFTNITKIDQGDGDDDDFVMNVNRFSRSILRLKLEHTTSGNTPEIMLYGGHFKAKVPTNVRQVPSKHRGGIGSAVSTIKRTAEAAALRWILTNQMKGNTTPTVVVGDLNDDPRSNTLAIVTEQPNMSSSAGGSDTALYSALQMQQLLSFRDVYYTHVFRNSRDALDHILLSKEFLASFRSRKWKLDDARIWNDYIDDSLKHTSDHGIIKASFK